MNKGKNTAGKNLPPPNEETLRDCFYLYADDAEDKRVNKAQFIQVLNASSSRLTEREIEDYITEVGDPDRFEWNQCAELNAREKLLDKEWAKVNPDLPKTDTYRQVEAAMKVFVDSAGQGNQVDLSLLKDSLMSCGEEITDDEFDDLLKEIGHATKGKFNPAKFLDKYVELATKTGQKAAAQAYQPVKDRMDAVAATNKPKPRQSVRVTVKAPTPEPSETG